MAGGGRGDGRDRRDPSSHQGPPLGRYRLGPSNAAEALITAGLIQHYFGADFNLVRLRQVLGLLLAAIVGTAISGIGGAVTYRLFHGPSATMLTTWQHWFASDAVGIIAVAPLVIGLAAAVRRPPPRSELIEGAAALVALAVMTGIMISLPQEPWETVVPIALLFPMLLWLAARCRPAFAAAGAFLVSITIVWTTVFGIGHFGDTGLPIDDRILQAQAAHSSCGSRRIRSCCAVCRAEGERGAPRSRKYAAGARTR